MLPIPPSSKELHHRAPFLYWPVGRREYFYAISMALLLPVAWGLMIFGWRVGVLLMAALGATFIVHWPLQRWTQRGKGLLGAHSLMSALLLVALSDPRWPPLLVALAAGTSVFVIWLQGGPGRERIHTWALMIVLLATVAVPWKLNRDHATLVPEAIVARDRLVMGDIRHSVHQTVRVWPGSRRIGGHDAIQVTSPATTLSNFWQELFQEAHRSQHQDPLSQREDLEKILSDTFAFKLPPMETLLLGVVPSYVGAGSILLITLSGLFLVYRNIVRAPSLFLFSAALLVGFTITTLYSGMVQGMNTLGVWGIWQSNMAEMASLVFYQMLSGDVIFAAVFILAVPGTEPITPRARRIYLILAGITAAVLHRYNWPIPTTTITLAAYAIFSPLFDMTLSRKSWMNRGARW